jgi:osmotically-inducible protein OsmY
MRTVLGFVVVLLLAAAVADAASLADEWTAARTKVALLGDTRVAGAHVAHIIVAAEGGRVRLDGRVADDDSRRVAGDIAGAVRGVTTVENALVVVPTDAVTPLRTSDKDMKKLVVQGMAEFRRLARGRGVTIEMRDGVATVTGRVDDVADWAGVSVRVREIPGVKAVDNRLWIRNLAFAKP